MSTPFVRRERLPQGIGEDPSLYALRLYVQFLQGLFNFADTGLFHWEPDDEISEIVIRAQAPLDMKTVGKRPAITVIMGPYQYSNLSFDNLLSFDPTTGERIRTDLLSAHLIVYCLADSDLVSMRLAHAVSHHTRVHQRLLESPGGFYQIARPSPSINSPSPPGQLIMGDAGGLVMTQVNIPFQLQWTWSSTPKENPSLQSLEQITGQRRASEYDYKPISKVEHIQLAMSTKPVVIKRVTRGQTSANLRYATQPETVVVHEGIEDFQISGLEAFQTEQE
jgi:hypothetical protein